MVFSDGGARGNPGPAATAFIIQTETGETLTKNSSYIGVSTNNQAEYHALLSALTAASALKADTVTCHSDSELIIKQLTGEYRVKNEALRDLWQKVQETKKQFHEVRFVNVPRSNRIIQEVDKLVNLTLDARTKQNSKNR
jgi:ribonuclease HI